MNKTSVPIKGMHCKSCELLIEDELVKIKGVKKVDISHRDGTAQVYYDNDRFDQNEIKNAVERAGYKIGTNEKPAVISSRIKDYIDLLLAFAVAGLLYLIANELGLFSLSAQGSGGYGNLSIVLLVGLTAGISTCMALVGGLILGVSGRYIQNNPTASTARKFIPHLFFNAGRIMGFFVLGGLVGVLGSLLQFSPVVIGGLTVAISVVMVFLGLQLSGIFPALDGVSLTLPKGISRMLGITEQKNGDYSSLHTMILGTLTFFLPCGFTQAMQLYAVSTGSFMKGALVMAVFAVGTAPGLLGVGGLTSLIKGSFSKFFFKVVAVVVVAFALFNISNGFNLVRLGGWAVSQKKSAPVTDPNVKIENGVQIVRMTQTERGYEPNSFTIRKGMPVKWIVKSSYPYSCASSLVMPKYHISAILTKEEKTFEFTPQDTGEIPFSCSMGMYTGGFNVTEN